ncbi:MAG: GNAT family N-acetyltransferase [Candidatus Riflebacteria bacterium]|nr:GNAT family N-acetyltransferase [Candidatus Riflebacteria bacterium]
MNFLLVPVEETEINDFKTKMQESFQKRYEEYYAATERIVLTEKEIDQSLAREGSIAYKALVDGEMKGGAIVVINKETQHNYLAFLFVKYGLQNKGVGVAIWNAIKQFHPETKVWETGTPYFDKRNIHIYVNKCGFSIVEFYNEKHPDPNPGDSDPFEEFFVFRKTMTTQ